MYTILPPSWSRPPARRGGTILIVALCLTVLMGFLALVVDLGYSRLIRAQLQMGAEAASLAASQELNGTEEGMEAAVSAAITFAEQNTVGGEPLAITSGDVELGVWDGTDFTSSTDASAVNAARVNPTLDGVPTFFGKVAFESDDLTVHGKATTTKVFGGAGAVECFLPFAIPSCLLEDRYDLDTINYVDLTLKTSSAVFDTMGWARPGTTTPSATWIRSQILNCTYDGETEIGDSIGLNNGAITTAMTALASEINNSDTSWDTDTWGTQPSRHTSSLVTAANWGKTLEAPIIVFEDDTYCTTGGSFTGNEIISGFVWGAVYEVANGSGTSNKFVRMRLDTQNIYSYGTKDGGPDYGIIYEGAPTFVN